MAPAAGVAASAMPLGAFDQALLSINTNPYFIGSMMLMMNFGGRFLAMEMSPGQEAFFQNKWVRRSLIFIVVFMGTRNILVAFWMSLLIILLIGYLFNENSSLCIFHLGKPGSSCASSSSSSSSSSFSNQPSPPQSYGSVPQPTSIQSQSQIQPSVQFTPEEADIFKKLSEKQLKIAAQNRQVSTGEPSSPKPLGKSISDIYWQNMMLLNRSEGFIGNPRF
jgi:hypothetical protein